MSFRDDFYYGVVALMHGLLACPGLGIMSGDNDFKQERQDRDSIERN